MTCTKSKQLTHYSMGTVVTHQVHGKYAEEAIFAAKSETTSLENKLSRYKPESEISKINALAGKTFVKVSQETYELLKKAKELSRCSNGCFDITIGPLVDLWKKASYKGEMPDKTEINHAVSLVNFNDLLIHESKMAVMLKRTGQSIDLGGIGKGYAADIILDAFRKFQVTSAFTDFGGNIATIGTKPDGTPWRIGIQHPRKENGLIGVVSVVNHSVVTSGDYRRSFTANNGLIHHHILDPNTGHSSDSGLISVTVISDSSITADALSTIFFIAGLKKGLSILHQFKGMEAIIIDSNWEISITEGLKYCFQPETNIFVKVIQNKGERQYE